MKRKPNFRIYIQREIVIVPFVQSFNNENKHTNKNDKNTLVTCLYTISIVNINIPTKLEKIIKPQAIMYLLSERKYRI